MKKNRRLFLKNLALSTISIPVGAHLLRAETSTVESEHQFEQGKTLRVALMGLGGYAKAVAEGIQKCKRVKITGLISGTPEKLEEWGTKYGVPIDSRYNYDNFDNIKSNENVDAIYVITPNALHHDQVIRSAKAKKHVICEKPMAISAAEGRNMVEICEKEGVKLLVGYRMRFEPNTLEIKKLRESGELGKIQFFQGLSGFKIGDPNQWRVKKDLAGGGALMDIGIYAINGARYMTGEDPIWVTAQETKTNPEVFEEGVDETIQFQLGFPSGAVASCLSTYNMNHLDRFLLIGEKGSIEQRPSTGYGPIKTKVNGKDLDLPHVQHQTIQMDHMASILLDGTKPVISSDGKIGLDDLVIIEAIYEACKTGNKVEISI